MACSLTFLYFVPHLLKYFTNYEGIVCLKVFMFVAQELDVTAQKVWM